MNMRLLVVNTRPASHWWYTQPLHLGGVKTYKFNYPDQLVTTLVLAKHSYGHRNDLKVVQFWSLHIPICSKSPCSIAISSWPYLQDSPSLQLSRKVVRTRSEHSSQSAHTLHYVRTHPGTIAERDLISAKLARLCGDSRPHWVQTEKAEIPSWVSRGAGQYLPE
jgi:hypothetical protein